MISYSSLDTDTNWYNKDNVFITHMFLLGSLGSFFFFLRLFPVSAGGV